MAVAWAELVVKRVPPQVEGAECDHCILLLLIQGALQDCLPLRNLLLHCLQTHWPTGREGCSMCRAGNFLKGASSPKWNGSSVGVDRSM